MRSVCVFSRMSLPLPDRLPSVGAVIWESASAALFTVTFADVSSSATVAVPSFTVRVFTPASRSTREPSALFTATDTCRLSIASTVRMESASVWMLTEPVAAYCLFATGAGGSEVSNQLPSGARSCAPLP